jgi:hypothetical protein
MVGGGGVGRHQVPEHDIIERDRRLVDQLDSQTLLSRDGSQGRVDEGVGQVDFRTLRPAML